MKSKILIAAAFFIATGTASNGQGSGKYGMPGHKDFDTWSVGVSMGSSYLFGDILKNDNNNNNALKKMGLVPAFGVQLNKQISHSVALRLSYMNGKLKGGPNDELVYWKGDKYKVLNAEVESPLSDYALEGVYTFGNISHLKRNKKFHFTTSFGIGFYTFDTDLTGNRVRENAAAPGGKDTVAFSLKSGKVTEFDVPFGLGFKYQVGKVDVSFGLDYRKTFTDKVDVSSNPVTENGNFMFVKLGANYTLGKKNKAMEWINPLEVVYNDLADVKDRVDLLSGDKDKDGVSDIFDKDNSTEEGVKVYGDGTAIDTDSDGIADYKDGDPYSLKGAKVNENGVEIDTDGDGVPDGKDLEPNTPKGTLVNFQGSSIENALANSSGSSSGANGLNGAAGTSYLPSVFFDVNSSEIKQVYKDRILVIARAMKAKPGLKVTISGNTDRSGSEAANNKLGLRRADAVKNHLIKVYGIDASRIVTETKGMKEPMADRSNAAMDRRVDFNFSK